MKIKYVFKQTVVGWNWHPVIDDQVLFYPHGTLNGVRDGRRLDKWIVTIPPQSV